MERLRILLIDYVVGVLLAEVVNPSPQKLHADKELPSADALRITRSLRAGEFGTKRGLALL